MSLEWTRERVALRKLLPVGSSSPPLTWQVGCEVAEAPKIESALLVGMVKTEKGGDVEFWLASKGKERKEKWTAKDGFDPVNEQMLEGDIHATYMSIHFSAPGRAEIQPVKGGQGAKAKEDGWAKYLYFQQALTE